MAVPQPKQTPTEKARIIRGLPDGTNRVQVMTGAGRTKFKKPNEIAHDDQIMLNKDGEAIVMRGRPGRKPKVDLQPVNENVGEVMEARQDHIINSDLVMEAGNNPDSDGVIDNILSAMADEAAALEFERLEAERHGRDASGISAKRARVLKGMADVWLKRKQVAASATLDLDSPGFQVAFTFMLETVRGSLEDAGARPEFIETIFTKLSKRLGDGWKEEAKARVKEKT